MPNDIELQKRLHEERLNHEAYLDVLDCKQPQLINNEIYMKFYLQWRPLQKFLEDLFDDY